MIHRRLLGIFLLITLVPAMASGGATTKSPGETPSAIAVMAKPLPEELHLADLIPRAAELSIRLADLKQKQAAGADLSAVENNVAELVADLKQKAAQLQRLKASADYTYSPLVQLSQDLKLQRQPLDRVAKPIADAIRELEVRRSAWQLESRRWQKIGSGIDAKELPQEVETMVAQAQDTIAKALNFIRQAMQPILALQQKVAELNVQTETMMVEVTRLIRFDIGADQVGTYPPLISSKFFSQIKSAWKYQIRIGLDRVDWRYRSLLAHQGWMIIIQALLALVLIVGIYRRRKTLERTKRLQFLTKRPFAAGVFIAIDTFHPFYATGPTWLNLFLAVGGGLSFLRLIGGLFEETWKKQALFGLAFFLIGTRVLSTIEPPLPVIRMFAAVTSAAGIYFCLRWAGAARRRKDAFYFIAGLRLVACYLAVVLAAELWGKAFAMDYLLFIPARTIGLTLVWWLLMRSTRGLLEWIVHRSGWYLPNFVSQNPEATIRRATFIGKAFFGISFVCVVLVIWDLYLGPAAAFTGVLSFGFTIGSQRISIGLVAEAALLAYGAFVASWAVQHLLLKKEYNRRRVDTGVRFAINRLIKYAFVFVGFSMALGVLGIKLTQLTIIISALGVGIGFGLRDIVNNFICGLILLFERPVRVGDAIVLQGKWAEVKRIGLRATEIRTYDNADVIVPNNDLITGQVTNWTLHGRMMRLKVPVGVACGSDIPRVIETLLACVKDHPDVAARPEPEALFLKFGDSTFDFELRVWIVDFDDYRRVWSEIHQQIGQHFRAAGIEIAYPQRDLHLRSIDKSVREGLVKPEN
jgi:small-conductance mechanosensitive channel